MNGILMGGNIIKATPEETAKIIDKFIEVYFSDDKKEIDCFREVIEYFKTEEEFINDFLDELDKFIAKENNFTACDHIHKFTTDYFNFIEVEYLKFCKLFDSTNVENMFDLCFQELQALIEFENDFLHYIILLILGLYKDHIMLPENIVSMVLDRSWRVLDDYDEYILLEEGDQDYEL